MGGEGGKYNYSLDGGVCRAVRSGEREAWVLWLFERVSDDYLGDRRETRHSRGSLHYPPPTPSRPLSSLLHHSFHRPPHAPLSPVSTLTARVHCVILT